MIFAINMKLLILYKMVNQANMPQYIGNIPGIIVLLWIIQLLPDITWTEVVYKAPILSLWVPQAASPHSDQTKS